MKAYAGVDVQIHILLTSALVGAEWPTSRDIIYIIIYMFFNSHCEGGVQTECTQHVGHFCPIVPAPGDGEYGEFDRMKIGKGNRNTLRKPTPAPIYPPQIPLDETIGASPGRRGGKPATNRLSYGAAY
jgi:hypothetical protein